MDQLILFLLDGSTKSNFLEGLSKSCMDQLNLILLDGLTKSIFVG